MPKRKRADDVGAFSENDRVRIDHVMGTVLPRAENCPFMVRVKLDTGQKMCVSAHRCKSVPHGFSEHDCGPKESSVWPVQTVQKPQQILFDVLPAVSSKQHLPADSSKQQLPEVSSKQQLPAVSSKQHLLAVSSKHVNHLVRDIWKKTKDFSEGMSLFRRIAECKDGCGPAFEAAKTKVNDLLDMACHRGHMDEVADVISLIVKLRGTLDVHFFSKVCGRLVKRIPAPRNLVRLLMNLAFDADTAALPLESSADIEASDEDDVTRSWEEYERIVATIDAENAKGRLMIEDGSARQYYAHFVSLIHIEHLHEIQEVMARLRRSYGIGAEFETMLSMGGKKSPRVELRFLVEDRHVTMRPGDSVLISRTNPFEDLLAEGIVALIEEKTEDDDKRSPRAVIVCVNLIPEEALDGHWRLDPGPNWLAYDRQMQALLKTARTTDSKRPPLLKPLLVSGVGTETTAGGELLELCAERIEESSAECLTDEGLSLNYSQQQATKAACRQRVTLIQGPPGTGKTHVSIQILAIHTKSENVPVLATSDSNIAVDNIAEGCIKAGLNVVRVGRPEKVTSGLGQYTLEALSKKRAAENYDWKWDWKDYYKHEILNEADVICMTNISAGSDMLASLKFSAILIDEAAHSTEVSALVPISLRGADSLTLVGDHCQLPPTVYSSEAGLRGLSISLFGRLVNHGIHPHFLDTQFRMHSSIASFSADAFYDGRLKTGVPAANRPAPRGFDWPLPDCNVALVNVVNATEVKEGDSWMNQDEAVKVVEILIQILIEGELTLSEIGVISPYSSQVRSLQKYVRKELRELCLVPKGEERALEIASIDAFQGREKELIIFSAVRCDGRVGFLSDWRRLNVMVTRARRGLLVVANKATLRRDKWWREWLRSIQQTGSNGKSVQPATA